MYKKHALAAVSVWLFLLMGGVAFAQSPIEDSFDTYATEPWTTFGATAKNFDFTDGTNGECVENGCIVGNGQTGQITRIYKAGGTMLEQGALTVQARAKDGGFGGPTPLITLCQGPSLNCGSGTRLNVSGLPIDDTWHQYLLVWRQGLSNVELCSLKDSLETKNCIWGTTSFAPGTAFDGVALWSTTSYRSDLGTNLWFDELRSAITVDLTTTAPEVTDDPIMVEATFSAPVTGFEASDVMVTNGSTANFVAVSGTTYTFDVIPLNDGLVIIEVSAESAEGEDGETVLGAAPIERTIEFTGPTVTIVDKTTNELSPVMTGAVTGPASTSVALLINAATYPAEVVGETWSAIVAEGALTDGTYTAVARATDPDGNVAHATGTLVIDRTAPTLTITSGPAEGSITNQHSTTFGINSNSPMTCSIDESEPVSCSGSFSASGLDSGTHVFVVTSVDSVGNIAQVTRTWHIDAVAPIVTEVHAVETPSEDTTPDYIFNTTKAGTITYGGSCSSATVAAVVGDNNITFNELAPGTYSDCTIVVTDSVGNASEPLAVSTFTIETPPPQEEVVTLSASADTYVRKGASNTNEGASPIIRIRAAGDNRGLVRFDQAAIAAAVAGGTLVSASLEFTIEEAKNNWGKQGREVSAYRLLMPWTEGNGKNGELPGNQSFRGTGAGATWDCAKDTNITNMKSDCAAADDWEMRLKKTNPGEQPWTTTKSDSTFIQKRQEGVVAFDVTADIGKFVAGTATNYGWVIKKEEENKAGYVTFFSKESAGAAPELILTVRR